MTDSAQLTTDPLATLIKGIWWWVLVRGILAIVFGVIALIAPATALTAIAIVFGAYALVDGVMAAIQAVRMRASFAHWGWLLAQGIISALAGLAALVLPGLAGAFGGLVVLWTIVIWNVMHGFAGIRSASGASAGRAKTWGVVGGVVSILFGIVLAVLVLLTPGATLLGLVWAVGIYAVVFGVTLVVTAIQVRIAARSNSAEVGTA
ncbi:HdeD family acid-resistance protein [soil metagenome]